MGAAVGRRSLQHACWVGWRWARDPGSARCWALGHTQQPFGVAGRSWVGGCVGSPAIGGLAAHCVLMWCPRVHRPGRRLTPSTAFLRLPRSLNTLEYYSPGQVALAASSFAKVGFHPGVGWLETLIEVGKGG